MLSLLLLMMVIGVVLLGVLVWVGLKSSEEGQMRDRRVERDLDLRKPR